MTRSVTLPKGYRDFVRSGATKGLYHDGKDSSVATLPQNDMIREIL